MSAPRMEIEWGKAIVWAIGAFLSLAAILGLIVGVVEAFQWLLE